MPANVCRPNTRPEDATVNDSTGREMTISRYRPLTRPPEPVEAFEAAITVGVSPFTMTSFKASLTQEGW